MRTLAGHTEDLLAVASLPGGLVGSASEDETVAVWRVADAVGKQHGPFYATVLPNVNAHLGLTAVSSKSEHFKAMSLSGCGKPQPVGELE